MADFRFHYPINSWDTFDGTLAGLVNQMIRD